MNFSNITSYINIPAKDTINNFLTNSIDNILFSGRFIKKQLTDKRFLATASFTFAHASLTVCAWELCGR